MGDPWWMEPLDDLLGDLPHLELFDAANVSSQMRVQPPVEGQSDKSDVDKPDVEPGQPSSDLHSDEVVVSGKSLGSDKERRRRKRMNGLLEQLRRKMDLPKSASKEKILQAAVQRVV